MNSVFPTSQHTPILFTHIVKQWIRIGCRCWYNWSLDRWFLENVASAATLCYIFHRRSSIIWCLWFVSGRSCTFTQFLHFDIASFVLGGSKKFSIKSFCSTHWTYNLYSRSLCLGFPVPIRSIIVFYSLHSKNCIFDRSRRGATSEIRIDCIEHILLLWVFEASRMFLV